MADRVPPMAIPKSLGKSALWGAHRDGGITHWGIDIPPSAPNTAGAVVVPEDSTVVEVWTDDSKTTSFRGYVPAGVLLRGDSGRFHLLAHLSPEAWSQSALPRVGQRYSSGEQIGLVATGLKPQRFWAAPHVHWEVRAATLGKGMATETTTLDPVEWLKGNDVVARPNEWMIWVVVGYVVYSEYRRRQR
jgi:murein DD-endopeptidase MepM/ murein hydrolase activator NlpD